MVITNAHQIKNTKMRNSELWIYWKPILLLFYKGQDKSNFVIDKTFDNSLFAILYPKLLCVDPLQSVPHLVSMVNLSSASDKQTKNYINCITIYLPATKHTLFQERFFSPLFFNFLSRVFCIRNINVVSKISGMPWEGGLVAKWLQYLYSRSGGSCLFVITHLNCFPV